MAKKLAPLMAALALILSACGWSGSGVVVEKDHHPGYTTMILSGKTMVPMYHPPCYEVTVEDAVGEEHSPCIEPGHWEEVKVGDEITVTD